MLRPSKNVPFLQRESPTPSNQEKKNGSIMISLAITPRLFSRVSLSSPRPPTALDMARTHYDTSFQILSTYVSIYYLLVHAWFSNLRNFPAWCRGRLRGWLLRAEVFYAHASRWHPKCKISVSATSASPFFGVLGVLHTHTHRPPPPSTSPSLTWCLHLGDAWPQQADSCHWQREECQTTPPANK